MDRTLRAAHRHCARHNAEVLASTRCGCFYCERTFAPVRINIWLSDLLDDLDEEDTALCPFCGMDSVIGDRSGYPIDDGFFLAAMKAFFF